MALGGGGGGGGSEAADCGLQLQWLPSPGSVSTGSGGMKQVKCPVEERPDTNYVGRILGPRGSTLKAFEAAFKCRIFLRGSGSLKKDEEERKKGQAGFEHLNEPLHVQIDGGSEGDVEGCAAAMEKLIAVTGEDEQKLRNEQSAFGKYMQGQQDARNGGAMRGGFMQQQQQQMGQQMGYGGQIMMAQPMAQPSPQSGFGGGVPQAYPTAQPVFAQSPMGGGDASSLPAYLRAGRQQNPY